MTFQLTRFIFQKQHRIPLLVQLQTMSNRIQLESNSNQDQEQSSTNTFDIPFAYKVKQYKPKGLMQKVSYMLIRPPRFVYNQKLLLLGKKTQEKYSYEVHNIPFPVSIYWADEPKYIILYLHGNSSSRFQGYLHLNKMPQGACLACFDFNGCGLRKQSDFITLGKQQSKQVDAVAKYLKQFGLPIVGWGRSMGAVSLLMSSECDVMITDSPFSSLYDLCKETSTNASPKLCCCFVHCFFPCVFWCVRNSVQQLSGMDPNQLQVIHAVQKIDPKKKLLMLAGKNDTMIHYSHSQRLIQAFRGEQKKLILFQGTHNSNRPQQVLNQCYKFIDKSIQNFVPPKNVIKHQQNLTQNMPQTSKQFNIIKISQCPKNRKKCSQQKLMNEDIQEDLAVKRQSSGRTSFKQISKLNMLMNMHKKQKFLPPLGDSQMNKSKLFNTQSQTNNNSLQMSTMRIKNSKIEEQFEQDTNKIPQQNQNQNENQKESLKYQKKQKQLKNITQTNSIKDNQKLIETQTEFNVIKIINKQQNLDVNQIQAQVTNSNTYSGQYLTKKMRPNTQITNENIRSLTPGQISQNQNIDSCKAMLIQQKIHNEIENKNQSNQINSQKKQNQDKIMKKKDFSMEDINN